MQPVQVTVTGTGVSDWIRLDRRARTLNTLFVGRILTGTATYNLEMTEQNPPSSAPPFIDPGMNQVTANAWVVWEGFVFAYARLHVTAGGAGKVILTVLQGGP